MILPPSSVANHHAAKACSNNKNNGAVKVTVKLVSGGDGTKNEVVAAAPVLATPMALSLLCAGPGRCSFANNLRASAADPVMSFPLSSLHLSLLPCLCFTGML